MQKPRVLLLQNLNHTLKIKDFISAKMQERIFFYKQCKIILEDHNISDETLINSIHLYISSDNKT